MKKYVNYIVVLLFILSGCHSTTKMSSNSPDLTKIGESQCKQINSVDSNDVKSPDGFKRIYSSDVSLCKCDENQIINLARKMGICDIASIQIVNVHSNLYECFVSEKEIISGRQITTRVLHMQKWIFPDEKTDLITAKFNDIWICSKRDLSTRTKTILKLGDKDYRVHLSGDLTIGIAEQVLSLFLQQGPSLLSKRSFS